MTRQTPLTSTLAPAGDTDAFRRTPLVSGLNHAAVVTSDLGRLVQFYVDVFDAQAVDVPAPPGTGPAAMVFLAETTSLAVIESRGNPNARGSSLEMGRGHLDHIALDAPSGPALEEIRRRLVATGASDGIVNDYGPMLSVHFEDPDGMASEVCWQRAHRDEPAHPPVPYEGSLLEA